MKVHRITTRRGKRAEEEFLHSDARKYFSLHVSLYIAVFWNVLDGGRRKKHVPNAIKNLSSIECEAKENIFSVVANFFINQIFAEMEHLHRPSTALQRFPVETWFIN